MQLQVGQTVRMISLAGIETGRIHSINTKAEKVDIYFDDPICPHYWRANYFNILEVVA